MQNAQELIQKIRQTGNRLTPVRAFIVEFLSGQKSPHTAREIEKAAHQALGGVNKTTIYREIKFLLNQEAVAAIEFGDRKKRYEIAGRPHHHHAVCTNCRNITDIPGTGDMKKLEAKIRKDSGFQVSRHALEFFGLCAKCSNN